MDARRTVEGLLMPYGLTDAGTYWGPRTHITVRKDLPLTRRSDGRLSQIGRVTGTERRKDGLWVVADLGTTPDAERAYTDVLDGYLPCLEPVLRVVAREPIPAFGAASRMIGKDEVLAAVLQGVRLVEFSTASPLCNVASRTE